MEIKSEIVSELQNKVYALEEYATCLCIDRIGLSEETDEFLMNNLRENQAYGGETSKFDLDTLQGIFVQDVLETLKGENTFVLSVDHVQEPTMLPKVECYMGTTDRGPLAPKFDPVYSEPETTEQWTQVYRNMLTEYYGLLERSAELQQIPAGAFVNVDTIGFANTNQAVAAIVQLQQDLGRMQDLVNLLSKENYEKVEILRPVLFKYGRIGEADAT